MSSTSSHFLNSGYEAADAAESEKVEPEPEAADAAESEKVEPEPEAADAAESEKVEPEPEAADAAESKKVEPEGVSSVDDIVYSKGVITKISDMSDNNSRICLSGFEIMLPVCI